jgi:ABC-type polar amino acid transport system ATPase subunit
MYKLQNVHKSYESVFALHDISCEIPTDRFVFVMGPSGSGKSTLLRLMSFVEEPDDGLVQLKLGNDVFNSTESERPWPRATCVFQKQFLWPHLTLRQNIQLPLNASGQRDADRKANHVIDLLDMHSFVDRYSNEVSGGQAQRAAIARALALEPELLLVDEAHGGLDLIQQQILNTYFLKLRASGVGLIIVTHSIGFARRFADLIIIIEDGRITELGGSKILENPTSQFLQTALAVKES